MNIPYLLVDAFTGTPGTGNRAALILDARGMRTEEMREVAERLGVLESTFVIKTDGEIIWVRFFTPSGEIEFGGHAALALALTLAREGEVAGRSRIFLRTTSETVAVNLHYQAGEPVEAIMRSPAPRFRDLPLGGAVRQATKALGANERWLHRGLPIGIAFSGLWSLFVPFIAPGLVDALEPSMEILASVCNELEIVTVHAYAPLGPRNFYARDFAPLLTIPEDPVSGSVNGALAALLARARVVPQREGSVQITVLQGHYLGRPGTVDVRVDYKPSGAPYAVYIGGQAVVAQAGWLEL